MFQNFLSKLTRCEVELEQIGLLTTVGFPIRKSLIKLDRQLLARAELQVQLAEVRQGRKAEHLAAKAAVLQCLADGIVALAR